MYIENVYDRKHLIPVEYESNFRRKTELNMIEKIGLEAIAVEFMAQYEKELTGEEPNRPFLRGFIRWNADNVDILDGYHDTYEFDGYLFGELWMTENGIPMMTAFEIPEDCEDWTEHDWLCDFTARLFRLD